MAQKPPALLSCAKEKCVPRRGPGSHLKHHATDLPYQSVLFLFSLEPNFQKKRSHFPLTRQLTYHHLTGTALPKLTVTSLWIGPMGPFSVHLTSPPGSTWSCCPHPLPAALPSLGFHDFIFSWFPVVQASLSRCLLFLGSLLSRWSSPWF